MTVKAIACAGAAIPRACLVLILAAAALSCNDTGEQDSGGFPPPSQVEPEQPAQSQPDAAADDGGGIPAVSIAGPGEPDGDSDPSESAAGEAGTGASGDAGDSAKEVAAATEDDTAEGEGAEDKIPVRGNDDRYKDVERPKPRKSRPDDLVSIELRLRKAEYNDEPDSTLSHLTFEFRSTTGRMQHETIEVQLSDIRERAMGELDLGLCRVEVYPTVEPPKMTGRTGLGGGRFVIDGAFQIWVYQPADELIGVFAINAGGHFMSAPPDEAAQGYGVRARRHIDDYGPVPHTIYRKDSGSEHTEYLLTVQCEEGTFDSEKVKDPSHNEYEYRFPNALLEFYTPELAKLDR